MIEKPDGHGEAEDISDKRPRNPVTRWDGPFAPLLYWMGVGTSILHLYLNTLGTMSELWFSALHFGLFGAMAAIAFPVVHGSGAKGRLAAGLDILLAIIALGSAFYLIYGETKLYDRGVTFVVADWVFALSAILAAIEFARRTTGWIIPVLIVLALTYVAWWGRLLDGVFHFPGLTWETVLFRGYFSTDGMFGSIARISTTYVFMFILFGAFLIRSGAGDFILDLARVAAGRFVGGPGLVAVIGSSLMGSVSGSAVANTVSTGTITIPLMKKAGFPHRFAAGVEASASTGGQLMPPIMGAGAFIMASYTRIPYLSIIAVSALPAAMYFLSVAFWVRIEAKKLNLQANTVDAPRFSEALREGGHSLIPIVVLIGLLIHGFTPAYAAGVSILTVIASSRLGKSPMGPRAVLDALALGARNTASTAVLLIGIGLIVNVIGTTGLGNTLSLMIADWAGGSLFVTIVLVALASLALGMGLPVTAAYIVLGTLSAPALHGLIADAWTVQAIADGTVTETARTLLTLVHPEAAAGLGRPMPFETAQAIFDAVPLEARALLRTELLDDAAIAGATLSAHMIIFWLSQDSNVTPPVCLAAFAAAAIAGTKPMATGLTAWKIAKALYVIPLLFAYTPFLNGDFVPALAIFGFGTVGIYALTAALAGYMERPLTIPMRLGLVVAAGMLLWPTNLPWHGLGLVLFAGVFARHIATDKKNAAAGA